MDRRELLKMGALGAAGAWLPVPEARLDSDTAAVTPEPQPGANPSSVAFKFTLIMGGYIAIVFPPTPEGSAPASADVAFLLPDNEQDCMVLPHRPSLQLLDGKETTGAMEWELLGLTLTPDVGGDFYARDWDTKTDDREYHPTEATGWRSLKWVPIIPPYKDSPYSEDRLKRRTAALFKLAGGTLEGFPPDDPYARQTVWRFKGKKKSEIKEWKQAVTDQIRLSKTLTGGEVVIKREHPSGALMPLRITPTRNAEGELAVTLLLKTDQVGHTTYNGKDPLKHYCGMYQIFGREKPPDYKLRHIPRPKEKFPTVDNADPNGPKAPVFVAHPEHARMMPSGGLSAYRPGDPLPPPLCDASRVIRRE